VEGAELLVLEGAKNTIAKYKPLVIFEHGLGASNYYDTTPEKVYQYFQSCNMEISTLPNFIKKQSPLTSDQFKDQFNNRSNYYFIAHP
jgi:hypothetical protein